MKKIFGVLTSMAMALALFVMPVDAKETGYVKVNGKKYETLYDAIEANAEFTDPITMEINGSVSWETGAYHGSTPFEMNTDNLIFIGADENAKFIATGNGVGAVGMDHGTVTFKNLTIEDQSAYQYENGENAWEFTYLEFRGNTVFENVVFEDGILTDGESAKFINCSFSGHNNDSSDLGNTKMYGVWVANGKAEFKNCTFTGTRGLKTHEAYGTNVDSILVENCIFDNLSEKPGIAIGNLDSTTNLLIKNSRFFNCKAGDQKMYIYESDTNVDTFNFALTDNIECHEHTLVHHEEKEPSYTENGNKEYWSCDSCGLYYASETDKIEISDKNSVIIPKLPKATSVKLNIESSELNVNETLKLFATLEPTEIIETIVWMSSDENIATVKDGLVSAVAPGKATITVKTESGLTATCNITVNKGTIKQEIPTIDPEEPVKEVTVGVANQEKTEAILNESIKDETLKEAIEEKIAEGIDVNTVINVEFVKPEETSEEVKKDIEKVIAAAKENNVEVAQYLDINIKVMAGDEELGKITTTTEKLTFQVAVPEELKKEGRTFIVIRVHDGKVEELKTVEKDGMLTFETDKFSTYALTYKDAEPTKPATKPATKPTTPNTSDMSMIINFGIMAILSGMILVVLKKKESLR